MGTRPAISQNRQKSPIDASRQAAMLPDPATASGLGAAVPATPISGEWAMIRRSLPELRLCAVERPEVPKVLHLERRRVAGDLAREVEELDIGLGGVRASACGRQAFGLRDFLVVGNDLALELLREVGQELVLGLQF